MVSTIAHPIGAFTSVLLKACAFAGTGDVLKVQVRRLPNSHHCNDLLGLMQAVALADYVKRLVYV